MKAQLLTQRGRRGTHDHTPQEHDLMRTKAKADTASATARDRELAVIVTTAHRGVFFGYLPADQVEAAMLPLRSARNCLYWDTGVQGFLGLAATGPNAKCRIGPRADISLRDITAVLRCTPEAVERWEAATWRP